MLISFLLSVFAADVRAQENYAENLELIRGSDIRNTNHDTSPYRNTPMRDIVDTNHLGPRTDYLNNPGGNTEGHFPESSGGQFRISCEFSHFAYDDPLVFPDAPGASHLHMFWGNTDVNAFSTYDTLFNSGSSTCNGQELNRTGYWAPAMFDAQGNVRIPSRVIVYYKGYGAGRDNADVYPPGAAMIATTNYHSAPPEGDTNPSEFSFMCTNQFRGARGPGSNSTIPVCGDKPFENVLEMRVKFPTCWNRQDASNPGNWFIGSNGWGGNVCNDSYTTPNIDYIIVYPYDDDETTEGWYLASDVNMQTLQLDKTPGSTIHADWWGGWNPAINKEWIDNCTTYFIPGVPTGCGMGYLSDGGIDGDSPTPGRALKFRPQYSGPNKVPAEELFEDLCKTERVLSSAAEAAVCKPMSMQSDDCDVEADEYRYTLPSQQWQMLSLPCELPADVSIVDAFSDDIAGTYGSDWIIYTYDPSIVDNPYIDPGLNGRLNPGQGFWIIHTDDVPATLTLPPGSRQIRTDVSSQAETCLSDSGCLSIPLSGIRGSTATWNLIGNPFYTDGGLSLRGFRVSTATGECAITAGCTMDEAIDAKILNLPVFRYDGTQYLEVDASDSLDNWGGYWLAELESAKGNSPALIVPAPGSSMVSSM
ncbi:MAG: DUF1996 domain-containing protein [Granulosicoccus sp.]